MNAVYTPVGRKGGTLHRVRSSKIPPHAPQGNKRADCGQVLWSSSTTLVSRDGNTSYESVCSRCFPETKSKSKLRFTDANDYASTTSYNCTNEDPKEWFKYVSDLKLERVAGICSGGEVGLLSLLPRTRKELILFDHSYLSLRSAMLKFLVLQRGVEHAYPILTGNRRFDRGDYEPALPDVYRKRSIFACGIDGGYSYHDGHQVLGNIARHWSKFSYEHVADVCANLHKVHFVHGDVFDLTPLGPFDLVYFSNAFEHSPRQGGRPDGSRFFDILKPRGYVLATQSSGVPQEWEVVKKGVMSYSGWYHTLYRLPKKPKK